ncbi:alpha/beta fold hydrolase [Paraburkholderia saeva]|uniref:alpha/beta fold hydrolase n=1 Tax=Paraburkholderia saeva TaxID=2777537 RepID=UPI001DF997EE|nr:alpha/beta hydrolase [Paraburkholderia saeva]CAG4896020.1 Putative aminoacrylate hydrolase RutD [Paraburkholderia saeva]
MTDLILLHGGKHGSWCWEPLARVMEAQGNPFARIIALDMPGCGRKRDRDPEGLSLANIARELNGELRAAQVRDAVLVGHSIAGVLLPMMAVEDPALFSRLIYLTTSVPVEGQTITQMMGTSRQGTNPDEVGWPVDLATASLEDMSRAMFGRDLDDKQFAWLLTEVAQDKTPPATQFEPVSRSGYVELGMKATYIVTLRDDILPPAWQRRFAERLNCDNKVEIDTPHEPFVSHPQLLASTLIATAFA